MKVLLNKLKLNLVCSSHLIFGHVLISNIACIVSFLAEWYVPWFKDNCFDFQLIDAVRDVRGAVTVDAGIDQFPPPPPPDLSELKISGMAFCYGSVHTAAEGVDEKKLLDS